MRGRHSEKFKAGFPHHVYSKALNGNIVFYSVKDCIFYSTLYFSLGRKYSIRTSSLCLMPNHTHSQEIVPDIKTFRRFHSELNSQFASNYNRYHGRSGPLFQSPFGYAPKTSGKKIRENIVYIANNPVVGGLCDDVGSYRWNFIPYRNDRNPFSSAIHLSEESKPMRRSIRLCNYFHGEGLPLNYERQNQIYSGLSRQEKKKMIDYIISKYISLDYDFVSSSFGGHYENALMVMQSNSGAEYEIPEDIENYQIYTRMITIMRDAGYNMERICMELLEPSEIERLSFIFSCAGADPMQIKKFLHL